MASLPAKQGNKTKQNKSQLHEVSGVVRQIQVWWWKTEIISLPEYAVRRRHGARERSFLRFQLLRCWKRNLIEGKTLNGGEYEG